MSDISDLTLLSIFTDRTVYDRYREYINLDTLEPEIRSFIYHLDEFFKNNDADGDCLQDFTTWFLHCGPYQNFTESQQELYKHFLDELQKIEVSKTIVEKVISYYQALTAKKHIQQIIEDRLDPDAVKTILEEYEQTIHSLSGHTDPLERGYTENNLHDILETTKQEGNLKFRLTCLNEATKGLRIGHFFIVAAYVHTGKTSFVIDTVQYMAQQLEDSCVLYFNNEMTNQDVYLRLYSAALGKSEDIIRAYEEKAREAFINKMGGDKDKIRVYDINDYTYSEIVALMEKHKPGLVVLDQIDHVRMSGAKSEKEHERLKNLYHNFKQLSNKFCPIIAVSQADSSTRWMNRKTEEVKYQRYLDLSQLDGSKIGKPGAADFILSIGKDESYPKIRYLYLSKNRNGKQMRAEVKFNGQISRYENP